MKFVLLVEGYTERDSLQDFLKRWLDKQGLAKAVGIDPVNLKGSAHFVNEIVSKADFYLNKPNSRADTIAVCGLLDLYGLPRDFTNTNQSWQTQNVNQRYTWARAHIEAMVGNGRFRQFFAVHEIEAWLLSDPNNERFPQDVQKALKNHSKIARPEQVNFDKPPAKLLNEVYQKHGNRAYRKITDATNLFAELDPHIAYAKCPKLKEMLDEMLALAKAAGL